MKPANQGMRHDATDPLNRSRDRRILQRVPEEVIIYSPNRVGLPVVWWHYDHLGVRIRCFVPGGKT